jgi:preprotein translocase subunit SecD
MMNAWRWRAVLYGSFLVACFAAIWPPHARNGEPGKIKLGLDLRGGTRLVLQVMPQGAPPAVKPPVPPATVKEVMRVLERRVNEFGVADSVVTEYGKTGDQILVVLPGVTDVEKAKQRLISVAQLSLQIVEGMAPTRERLLRSSQGSVPPTLRVLEGHGDVPGESVFYLVHRQAVITGRDLKTVRVGVGDHGEPVVGFSLKPQAAVHFERETGRHLGRRLAIVLDERVVSAPAIEEPVGAQGQIRGRFTAEEADDLAKILRAGALPAQMRYLQELTVGPSLGRDSIRAGIVASAAALLFVTVFMLAYYRLSGLNAMAALAANLLVLLAAMAVSGASLTLPGIAGIILTVGVGVDTNVLVFERIREELRNGKPVRAAVQRGFDRVWITILDTHATALIAAAFLFQFGTGPIKGFAVTLVMGLVANVFASYFVSRLLFEWVLGQRQLSSLSIGLPVAAEKA